VGPAASPVWQAPVPETIADFLDGTACVSESPDVQRLRRLAIAVLRELDDLRAYVALIDPAVQAMRSIRPLAEVEQDHIEHAVRVTGSATAASRLLHIAPATIYRKLGEYEAARREEHRLRRLGARAVARPDAEPANGIARIDDACESSDE